MQDRSRRTVERILDAAARIFDEDGYRLATTNRVAEAAGVSVGSLYQYFPNKDSLLVALAERHVDEITAAFDEHLAALDEQAPPLEVVLRSLLDLTVALNSTSRLHAVLFTDCPRTPALEARLDRFTGAVVAGVARHLRRTGAGGTDPRRRAQLLVAACDAAVHTVVLGRRPGRARAAAVDDLVDLLLRGLVDPGRRGS
ncbi:MAG: TetR/AcrR family transcriptional regulator [Acidimicrobiia bacterium]